jgi:hypothetical protein
MRITIRKGKGLSFSANKKFTTAPADRFLMVTFYPEFHIRWKLIANFG